MAKPPRSGPRHPWMASARSKGQRRRGVPSRNRWSPVIPFGELRSHSGPRLRSIRNPASAGAPAAHLPEPGTLEQNPTPERRQRKRPREVGQSEHKDRKSVLMGKGVARVASVAVLLFAGGCDAGEPAGRNASPKPTVEKNVGRYPDPDPKLFEVSMGPKRQKARVGQRTSVSVRVRVPQEAQVNWEITWGDRPVRAVPGPPIVDCGPPPPGEPEAIRWMTVEKTFEHAYERPGRFKLRVYVTAADCGYGRLLRDRVLIKVYS